MGDPPDFNFKLFSNDKYEWTRFPNFQIVRAQFVSNRFQSQPPRQHLCFPSYSSYKIDQQFIKIHSYLFGWEKWQSLEDAP